jgi:hypothetical protein
LRTIQLSGSRTTSVITPSIQHEARQPSCWITDCIHGSRVMAPTPTPEKASPIAMARRRTNQFGRYCDCTLKLMQLAPAPTSTPNVA